MPGKPFDPTLKTLVETSPEAWPALAGLPGGPTKVIDADIATVSGAGDKVLHVRTAEPYLLHLEFQAGHDSAVLEEEMHVRSALLHRRHRLPVRSLAVLLRPEADSPLLTGAWEIGFSGEVPYQRFRYHVVRVWRLPPEPLLAGGVGTLPLAPISAVTEAELPGIVERMEQRLRSPRLRRYNDEVWSATYILLGLRFSNELARQLLRGVRSMKESVTYQAILEEGEAKGELKGALAEARKILRLQGRDRFGPPDERSDARLEGIRDVGLLEDLLVRLNRCDSWEELLKGVPAQRSPRRRK